MSGLLGARVKDPNYVLSFSLMAMFGLLALGTLALWRGQLLLAAEYQDFPITHREAAIKKSNQEKQETMRKKFITNYELKE